MSASTLALAVSITLLGLAAFSAPALIYAKRQGYMSSADVLLPVAPAVVLAVALNLLNGAALAGWGIITYPSLAAALSVILLYVRVFLFRSLSISAPLLSAIVLMSSCLAASLFGALAPPWYE